MKDVEPVLTTKRNTVDVNNDYGISAEKPDIAVVAEIIRSGLESGNAPPITVISNSMAPLLRAGDAISIANCTATELQRGDIIILQGRDSFMTHRYRGTVTDAGTDLLVTRGDRSIRFDPLWPTAALVGRITARTRANRCVLLTTGAGRFLNRHMALIATLEERLCGDSGTHSLAEWHSAEMRLIAATRHPNRLIRLYARSIHLGLALWAHAVVAIGAPLSTVTK